ncbi:hypothetical protein BC830DRAFT_1124194 [Chytriomyces sp. MP71]|nr:hypothetical protein BC830DRAFT_1124194 [Chytriomyces sp. MP71]
MRLALRTLTRSFSEVDDSLEPRLDKGFLSFPDTTDDEVEFLRSSGFPSASTSPDRFDCVVGR